MTAKRESFRLPDVGEGLTEAEVVRWLVQVGDPLAVEQPMVEIETAKATVELPSPHAGVVAGLHAAEGETVAVGAPLISIDCPDGGEHDAAPGVLDPSGEPHQFLIGYGPSTEPRPVRTVPERGAAGNGTRPLAKPPVRKRAKDLGVDLAAVVGTGPDGTVTRADVERQATQPPPPSDGTRHISRIRVPSIHRSMAAAMVASAFTAPHVTEFLSVDMTATMELRDRLAGRREFRGIRLTPLALVARALVRALRDTPEANSEWDAERNEIVVKHFVDLGIAVATERGLVVPHVADADRLSLSELAAAISEVTDTARAGRSTPASLAGGTITITNVGVLGIDTGTPILNPGQTAILAVGAIARRPWVVNRSGVEAVEPRWVAELALSFDHRVLDGRAGSRLLVDVAEQLNDPGLGMR